MCTVRNFVFYFIEETGGVLPGAKHVDYDHLFNEDGTIKSEEEVKACEYFSFH